MKKVFLVLSLILVSSSAMAGSKFRSETCSNENLINKIRSYQVKSKFLELADAQINPTNVKTVLLTNKLQKRTYLVVATGLSYYEAQKSLCTMTLKSTCAKATKIECKKTPVLD